MKYLWFVSGFVLIMSSCSSFICKQTRLDTVANKKAMAFFSDSMNVRKYKAKINYKTTEITGILICKKINDSTLAGGFINEFGIKGFDFTISDRHAKLGYVFKKIDKWYIRRSLETDLHFIFSVPSNFTNCSINDTSVYVAAVNRSIHYIYYNSNEMNAKKADMYKGNRKIASLQRCSNSSNDITIRMRYSNGSMSYEFCEINNLETP